MVVRLAWPQDAVGKVLVVDRVREILRLKADAWWWKGVWGSITETTRAPSRLTSMGAVLGTAFTLKAEAAVGRVNLQAGLIGGHLSRET